MYLNQCNLAKGTLKKELVQLSAHAIRISCLKCKHASVDPKYEIVWLRRAKPRANVDLPVAQKPHLMLTPGDTPAAAADTPAAAAAALLLLRLLLIPLLPTERTGQLGRAGFQCCLPGLAELAELAALARLAGLAKLG